MSTNTTNLQLTKQAGSEYYSIDVVNANLDKIDAGCVNVTGSQTISGQKTFSNKVTISNQKTLHFSESTNRAININTQSYTNRTTNPSSKIDFDICRLQAGDYAVSVWNTIINTSGARETKIGLYNGSALQWLTLKSDSLGGNAYVTAPVRTYSASNTSDVVTIGSLQASTDVVHTSGTETIGGNKTFTNAVNINYGGNSTALYVSTFGNYRIMQLKAKDYDVTDGVQHFLPSILTLNDKNDVVLFRIGAYSFPNGRVQIKTYVRNSDGSFKEAVLAEGDTIA